ncbi:MAG: hypothetical protein CL920_24950 [Deltaproteobacteria bacterium]|nr:hypothetical protein [Deltaproteobacteria bacterium]MBU51953.1 hypothetical protein [Deltaproteobacteria bacterium]
MQKEEETSDSPAFGEGKGDMLTKCAIFILIFDSGAVALVSSQSAPTPSTNLSIPVSLRLFPLPLRPSEEERGAFIPCIRGKLEF